MPVSQRCQYALRAILELAQRQGQGPIAIGDIAAAQGIPARFLEAILGQLRKAGVVESRRGVQGGYLLGRPPERVTVGAVIRLIDGPVEPVQHPSAASPALRRLWQRAGTAVANVYDRTTFADLLEEEDRAAAREVNYSI